MEEGLMERIASICRDMGIVDVGVADPTLWDTDPLASSRTPKGGRPLSIMPDARSVIVIGIPVQTTVLDTAPSIYYNHLYSVVNDMLDHAAERIALELMTLGHRAVYVPRDGYFGIAGLRKDPTAFFSHRHSAYLAGMGTFGYSGMLLTPAYGPRIRFTSIISNADIPCGTPMESQLCTSCGRCTKMCPAGAVPDTIYPQGLTDKKACVEMHAQLGEKGTTPCGRCIAVCPIGRDRGPAPTREAVELIRGYAKK